MESWKVRKFGRSYRKYKGRFLRLQESVGGYLYSHLSKKNRKEYKLTHILTAQAFLPNPNNLPEINHKDGNKQNNYAGTVANNYTDGNLEWCTEQGNMNHAVENGLLKYKKTSKFYGVSFHVGDKHRWCPWEARVRINKKCKYIGCFKTEIEAAQAYNKYVIEHSLNRSLNKV